MINKFREASSQIFVTFFIGLIIVGFVLTGYQGVQTSPDTVAKVGDQKITYREYKRVLDQQIQFFSYQFGGKSLTSKQIEDFQLKPRALDQLINQKLFLKFSEHLSITPSEDEVISEIKKIPAFKTQEKFDVRKYKNLLKANGLSPEKFEQQVGEDLKVKKLRSSISSYPISSSLASELEKIQSDSKKIKVINIPQSKLQKFVEVSKKEIQEYLEDSKNKKRVNAYFSNNKESSYDQKEQVKAAHILIKGTEEKSLAKAKEIKGKLNTKNFAKLANKHSEDPGNQKKKGGELGWFSKGRMVPEFESHSFSAKKGTISEPVKTSYGYHIIYVQDKKSAVEAKLSDYKNEIAKNFLQKDSKEKLKKIVNTVVKEVKSSIRSEKQLKKVLKKYELSPGSEKEINLLSDYASTNLSNSEMKKVLDKKEGEIEILRGPLETKIVFVSTKDKKDKKDKKENQKLNLTTKYEQKFLNGEIEARIKSLKEIYPPKSYLNKF
jgi:peptidyl-prolyl cis-trans isomerase D